MDASGTVTCSHSLCLVQASCTGFTSIISDTLTALLLEEGDLW